MAPLPEIGRINISGKSSEGMVSTFRIGESILDIKSIIPEVLKALIAKNNAINVGNILITVSIPSLQPSKKTSNTFIFSEIP